VHETAAQYYKFSEACAERAKRPGSAAVEWNRLAEQWKKLARVYERIPIIFTPPEASDGAPPKGDAGKQRTSNLA